MKNLLANFQKQFQTTKLVSNQQQQKLKGGNDIVVDDLIDGV